MIFFRYTNLCNKKHLNSYIVWRIVNDGFRRIIFECDVVISMLKTHDTRMIKLYNYIRSKFIKNLYYILVRCHAFGLAAVVLEL